jgi:hypothetical protein
MLVLGTLVAAVATAMILIFEVHQKYPLFPCFWLY